MFCSNCGAEISEEANFCFKCGAKVKQETVIKEENDETNTQERYEELVTRLGYIHTFMSDIISSRFDMSKNEYMTPQGISKYSEYMANIIECTNEDCMRTDCVTKKTIDKFAVDVDCFLQAIFEKHPELFYSKYVQETVSVMGMCSIELSKTGHIILSDELLDSTSEFNQIPMPKEPSVYYCFQQEFFWNLIYVSSKYGEDWYQLQKIKKILRDVNVETLNEQLQSFRLKLDLYKDILSDVCREVSDRLFAGDTTYYDIEKILDEFPADKAIETPRFNFEKKYKHFGMEMIGIDGSFCLWNHEEIFEFVMWDAENVEEIYLNLLDNDFYDEVNDCFYHDLLDFEIISIESQNDWCSIREGFTEILKIKVTNNYPELTLPFKPIPGTDSLLQLRPEVTFTFNTDSPKRYSQEFKITMIQ